MNTLNRLMRRLPEPLRYTIILRAFGFFSIPLIFYIRPQVTRLDDECCQITLKFRRRIKNHLNAIYFGALAIAAECTGGVAVMKAIRKRATPINLVFKDFHANFLKRVESAAVFTCHDVQALDRLVQSALETGQRQEYTFDVIATCPTHFGKEPVAIFRVTVSIKTRK